MATTYTPRDIPMLEKSISAAQKEAEMYQDRLYNSPTAIGGTGEPTSWDIENQRSYERLQNEIQSAQDNRLRAKWYPPKEQSKNAEEPRLGAIGNALNFISRPLYGIVGATKHALGQGTNSLSRDIADNMVRNRNTFSDVLRSSGVHGGVAAPLGFALDVALDPVNWLTAGTSAIIPRLGVGAYKGLTTGKGVMQGLSTAAKSGAYQKAVGVGKYIPYLKKSGAITRLGEKAIDATAQWEKLSGITAASIVGQKGIGVGSSRVVLGDGIKRIADAIPGGNKVLDTLWYSPKDWIRESRIKDVFEKHLRGKTNIKVTSAEIARKMDEGEDVFNAWIGDLMKEDALSAAKKIQDVPPLEAGVAKFAGDAPKLNLASPDDVNKYLSTLGDPALANKLVDEAGNVVETVDGAYDASKYAQEGDHLQRALRMTQEELKDVSITMDDIKKMVDSGALDATGIKWYDNFISSVRKYEKTVGSGAAKITINGNKIMDRYEQAIGSFKIFKVASSPAAYVTAVLGNLAATHMGPGLTASYIKNLKIAARYFADRPGVERELRKIIESNPEILPFLDDFATASRASFGTLKLRDLGKAADKIYDEAKNLIDPATLPEGMTKEMALEQLRDSIGSLKNIFKDKDVLEDMKALSKGMNKTQSESGTSIIQKILTGGGKEAVDEVVGMEKSGMMGYELYSTHASAKMMQEIAKRAAENPSHVGWKMLDVLMNKAPSLYDKMDQSNKLAVFLDATTHGYSVEQIRRIKNLVDITPEELALGAIKSVEEGKTLYKLSPKTALELANVLYLNYNAMPSAIRALRSAPLVGSPFISFMYGMALRTGQTFAYNPAAFNKITFAMNDFGGTKDPLEKKALESEYYSYLKEPGMYRLPTPLTFFVDYPVYMNLSNAIPYYSLSMFGVPNASYDGNTWREMVAGGIQRSPLFKDPVGSTIFDYIILPQILGESIAPQGMFGQPLYPVDATGIEKALYGTRSLAEAFTPNIAAYAGLVTPEAAAPYLPLYRWRALTNAKYGKNQLGISSKEPAANRTIREVLKATGIPLQAPVNTTFVQE